MRLTVLARPDVNELNRDVARAIIRILQDALKSRSRATFFLAGGSTPRPVYELLAQEYGPELSWDRVYLFWGDERWVPADDPSSNQRMAREAMIDPLSIPPENVFPIPTEGPPEEAAARYDRLLREWFPESDSGPDLVLQGLGPEGHTASLFPGSPALAEEQRWVAAVEVEATPARRLTVTLPFINRARNLFFLVTGRKKAPVVRKILVEEATFEECPAAGVRPTEGEMAWWLDGAAASDLPRFFRLTGSP